MYSPRCGDIAFRLQVLPQNLRRIAAESCCLSVFAADGNGRKLMRPHDTKANPRFGLDLLLQVLGELFVALRSNYRERVDIETVLALTLLVDA